MLLGVENACISPSFASSLLLFVRSCCIGIGSSRTKRFVWSAQRCLGSHFSITLRRLRKSENVSVFESYFAWSHLYRAISFKLSFMISLRNLVRTSVNVVSVVINKDWKFSLTPFRRRFWKKWRLVFSVRELLKGRKWFLRRCSNSLNLSFLPPNVGTGVWINLIFLFLRGCGLERWWWRLKCAGTVWLLLVSMVSVVFCRTYGRKFPPKFLHSRCVFISGLWFGRLLSPCRAGNWLH